MNTTTFLLLGESYGSDETIPSTFSDGSYSENLSSNSHNPCFPISNLKLDRPLSSEELKFINNIEQYKKKICNTTLSMSIRKEYILHITQELINIGKEYGITYSYFLFHHLHIPLEVLHEQLQDIFKKFINPKILVEEIKR